MLSINIPVYNSNVVSLIGQLTEQAEALQLPYEIRVYDDGSNETIKAANKTIAKFSNVVYVELEENIGRAAIRNKLGRESNFEYLLFIDADSFLVSPDYLKCYIGHCTAQTILCGGTIYSIDKPLEKEKLLRWAYGSKREAISARQRNQSKGFIITSNNFLVPKAAFVQVLFRESVKKYGHEDTLLGYDLYRNKFKIHHIENPIEHIGLEDATHFLSKTKQALQNLKVISEELLEGDQDFIAQINFLKNYRRITRFLPSAFLKWCFFIGKWCLEKNLNGASPRLFYFDLYKLSYYATLKNR